MPLQATEFLIILSTSLDAKSAHKSFNVVNIYNFFENFYSSDFPEQEKIQLVYELQHIELDVPKDPEFQKLSTITDLCKKLMEQVFQL